MKEDEMGGTYSTHGINVGVYKVLVRESEEKISLGRSSPRWEDNIKFDLKQGGRV
jgi:hypothetical protein